MLIRLLAVKFNWHLARVEMPEKFADFETENTESIKTGKSSGEERWQKPKRKN